MHSAVQRFVRLDCKFCECVGESTGMNISHAFAALVLLFLVALHDWGLCYVLLRCMLAVGSLQEGDQLSSNSSVNMYINALTRYVTVVFVIIL